MVGVILLKNTQNGSYRYARVTVYNGIYYTDINTQAPFTSYTVDIAQNRVVSSFSHQRNAPTLSVFELKKLFGIWRRIHLENPCAVQLCFKFNDGHFEIKPLSEKDGPYTAVNVHNIYLGKSLYLISGGQSPNSAKNLGSAVSSVIRAKVCMTPNITVSRFKASLLCGVLNSAVRELFGCFFRLYYYACGQIYLDIGRILQNKSLRKPFKVFMTKNYSENLYKTAIDIFRESPYNEPVGYLPRHIKKCAPFICEKNKCNNPHALLVQEYCSLKASVFNILMNPIREKKVNSDVLEFLFKLPHSTELDALSADVLNLAQSYCEKLAEYCILPEGLNEFIEIDELMLARFDSALRKRIIHYASARKKNYHSQKNVPPPVLIDRFGGVYL